MACDIPVVSTDCPHGSAEILDHGKWGRMVPVGDIGAMADAIAATLDDKYRPDAFSRASVFNVKPAVASYLEVLLPAGGFDGRSGSVVGRPVEL